MPKICDVACLFFSELQLEDSSFLDLIILGVNAYKFYLSACGNGFALMLPEGIEFANLNSKTSNGLRSLQEFTSMRYEAYVIKDEWTHILKSSKRDGKRAEFTAVVNVYGAREISNAVGERLSNAGIYLQHPDHCDPACEYENPHYFKLKNFECPKPGDFIRECSPSVSNPESILPDCNYVFDTLSRHKHLRDTQIDARIRTPLLWFVTLVSI